MHISDNRSPVILPLAASRAAQLVLISLLASFVIGVALGRFLGPSGLAGAPPTAFTLNNVPTGSPEAPRVFLSSV